MRHSHSSSLDKEEMNNAKKNETIKLGSKVWGKWCPDLFYEGKVIEIINKSKLRVEFLDGDKLAIDTSSGIVLEKELTEDEKNGVKQGDTLLVKLRQSRAMAQGVCENIGKVFFSVRLRDGSLIRKKWSGLRIFRPFTVSYDTCDNSADTEDVKVEKKLDCSVVIVSCKKGNCTCTNPGMNRHKPADDLLGSIESQTSLAKSLSPEILWGKKDLMEFSSPTDTVSKTASLNQDVGHEETIGLSLDPLAKLTPRFTSTPDISPIRSSSSTNVSGDYSQNTIMEVTSRSDTQISGDTTFEY